MLRASLLLLSFTFLAVGTPTTVEAGPIYVYTESDGSIRFTSKKPPAGVSAKVFTAKNVSYSVIGRRRHRERLFLSKYSTDIKKAAGRYNLEESLVRAVIHAESAFRPHAVSPKGAQGLMQLMPQTQRKLGVRNPFAPGQNIEGGSRYLATLLQKYSGNEQYALAAYNAGPKAVDKYGGVPPYRETRHYVQKVLRLRERYYNVIKG